MALFDYIVFCIISQLISTSSPWYDKLRAEIKYFEDINIDIDKLMVQNRESDKIRGQMAVLERRVQVSIDLNILKIHHRRFVVATIL